MSIHGTREENDPDVEGTETTYAPQVTPRAPDSYDPGEKDEDGKILCFLREGRPFEVEHFGKKNGKECLWWLNEHELSIRHDLRANDEFRMDTPIFEIIEKHGKRRTPKKRTREYVDRDAKQVKPDQGLPERDPSQPLSAARGGGRN